MNPAAKHEAAAFKPQGDPLLRGLRLNPVPRSLFLGTRPEAVMYKPAPPRVDYVQLEHEVQAWWDANGVPAKYMARNQDAAERWSFIDGPVTAHTPTAGA